MSEFTPEDAYRTHYRHVSGKKDGEPDVAFDDLSDSAIHIFEIESDLMNARLYEDESFAVSYVNNFLVGSYDEDGIAHWWQRPRQSFDGKTPQEMWAEDRGKVIELARSIAGPMDQS